MRHADLSLHVITMNREDQLFRLLSATRTYFDTIRVCDGGSTDNTLSLCRMFDCEIVERPWDDDMSAQHNVLLDQAEEGEWILIMDDDECPSPQLLAKLQEYAEEGNNGQNYNAINIPSIMYLNGIADWETSDLIKAIQRGEQEGRFTKTNFFRYDGKIRYSGISHYGLQSDILNTWMIRSMVPEPYFHYKLPIDQVRCNIQQAMIYPEMQGLQSEYSEELFRLLHEEEARSGWKLVLHDSRDILNLFDKGDLSDAFEDFLVKHRNPKLGTISDFYRYYFLYQNPQRLLPYSLLCKNLAKDPATRKFLQELGGYHSHLVSVNVGDHIEDWLPIGHLNIKPTLREILGTNQILWDIR